MNGGKDVRLGDDKRPVSIIPSNEDNLYNIANGEILTDEFGTPLITEVDQYFIPDATAKRSTSVVFDENPSTPYTRVDHANVGIFTATYCGDLDVYVTTGAGTTSGGTVSFASTVLMSSGTVVDLDEYPYLEVKTVADQGSERNRMYFDDSIGISTIVKVKVYDKVSGRYIPDGTFVTKVNPSRIILSNNATFAGIHTNNILIERATKNLKVADNVWKIEEQFKETSEVSTTLLGVPRAETQLSLFSNVSSYGLDPDEFEFYSFNGGISFGTWDNRSNQVYGNRYLATRTEEVQESAIRLEAFPPPYSYPFGPKFATLGSYNSTLFNQYLAFIQLGNDLFDYYDTGAGSGYPAGWKEKFLNPNSVYVQASDVEYAAGISASFAEIDTWTDTWRDIKDSLLIDPTDGSTFNFAKVNSVLNSSVDSTSTRPGYSSSDIRYSFLQSRRVFRYQPGRISGFTFGLKSSTEPVSGITLEWGITNPTDQYVFQIDAGQLKIIRRSTIPLESAALARSGLTILDQVRKTSGDPFDDTQYWTIEIPRDKFNGDPLNGNGPSGYLIQPNKVTMYKIEFGWYGAIGARFYAYIPAGPGEARWVVVHTLVIENSLGSPCLEDSYFRLKYSLNIANTADIRTPQFLYKYGASYYIDGGDEGTSQIYSVSTREKTTNTSDYRTLMGLTPKNFILNSVGTEIENKKLIIPTRLNVTTDSLTEVKVVNCTACPGFGHVYTPGVASTESGRNVEFEFTSGNDLAAINDSYFYESDIGAKVIAPSIYNAYIVSVSDPVGTAGSFESAKIQGWGPGYNGYPVTNASRPLAGIEALDRVTGVTTTVGITTYPYAVRLSNYDHYVASDFKFTGSKIELQFVNPNQSDDYGHFSDFLIGVTDIQPDVSIPDTLNGFVIGSATTTVLPNGNILYGEHTHTYATLNEDGVETREGWAPQNPQVRMGIDYRIPSLPSPSPGICSKATIEILDPLEVTNLNQFDYEPGNPPPNGTSPDPQGRHWIQIEGNFPAGVTFDGGQIALLSGGSVSITNSRFVGIVSTYTTSTTTYQYIEIDQSLGSVGADFTILIRPVQISANGMSTKSKLYNYVPYPLYLVMKLKDNAAINNISVKETVGGFERTLSPKFYTLGNVEITNADGNADVTGAAPTNFVEINRLSSALIDTQNEQKLRPGTTRDILYVGANSTQEIDMSKVFGADRNVITPDNNNAEATFIVAKKLDAGASGTVQASLNFKEQ